MGLPVITNNNCNVLVETAISIVACLRTSAINSVIFRNSKFTNNYVVRFDRNAIVVLPFRANSAASETEISAVIKVSREFCFSF